ncbi:hypothetical protein Tco_0359552 [Tanacetum coccineum]
MPPEDEVLPVEEQPLPAAVSPTADSPGYVPESDPEEDPEEGDDEDPEEDHVDYPANERDDGDDEDESSDDDDDVGIKEDEEEEEHLAPADSTAVAFPVVDHVSSAEEIEPFETDESAPHYTAPALLEGARSLLYLLHHHHHFPHGHHHYLRFSHHHYQYHHHTEYSPSPTYPLGYQAAMIRYEVEEISSAPTTRPPRGFRVDYGFVATMDREIMRDLERDVTERQLMAGQNMLVRDRRAHARTALLMYKERLAISKRLGKILWDASDLALSDVMSMRATVLGQQAVITELQAADRQRQAIITELLAADHRR